MTNRDPELRTGVHSLWEEGLLFDYTIEVDDHEFRAHKSVLASISGYFKVLLTNGMLESKQDRLKLPGFSSLAVQNMIEYIYQKKFGDTKASYNDLFELSTYLQIPSAVSVCTNELCKEMNPENCMDMFNLFMLHNITEGTEQVTTYIKSNLDAVLGVHKVDDLPSQLISHLHDCLGKSEWDLFCSLRDWVNADYDNHKQHVDGLMSKVRFPLMTLTELVTVKNQDIYTQCPGVWHDLIEKAITYQQLPTHKKVLYRSEQTRIRAKLAPVCFPVNDETSGFNVFHDEKTWEEHAGLRAPKFSDGVLAVVVNNFLIAYNQPSDDKCMYIFDPRTMTWTELASVSPREDFALVYHGQHLYAMGGRVGTNVVTDIMIYSFQTNEWQVSTIPLPHPIHKQAACVVKDTIFISGGKDRLAGPDTTQMHCLDLKTTRWTARAPLLNAMSCHQMNGIRCLKKKQETMMLRVLTSTLNMNTYCHHTDQWTCVKVRSYLPRMVLLELNTNSAIIDAGECFWLLNGTIEVDPEQMHWVVNAAGGVDPSQPSKPGVCFKLKWARKGVELVEVPEKFPLYVEGADENDALVKKYFTAMLSVPLHTRKARVGPRPCPATI